MKSERRTEQMNIRLTFKEARVLRVMAEDLCLQPSALIGLIIRTTLRHLRGKRR